MKGKSILLLLAAAGTLLLAGCQKTGLNREDGTDKAVRFSATTNAPGTKTAYGNTVNGSDGLPVWQSLDWIDGNMIRIYSPEAVRRVADEIHSQNLFHWADYKVTDAEAGTANNKASWSKAYLENATIDYPSVDYEEYYDPTKVNYHVGNGLYWGEESSATFYAVYPAPTGSEDFGTTGVSGVSGIFELNIPDEQSADIDDNMGNDSDAGNVGFAYMTAYAQANKPATWLDDRKDRVELIFEPAFTAFEISIRSAGDAIPLKSFRLVSDNDQALNGDFKVKYNNGVQGFDCSTATGDASKVITVDLEGRDAPKDKDLTFTVFALPQDFSKLHIEFEKESGEVLSLKLKTGSPQETTGYVTFTKCHKHRIYGLILPYGNLLISIGTAPWVKEDGAEFSFTTIEDVSLFFTEYRLHNVANPGATGDDTWKGGPFYIAVAPGRTGSEEQVNIGTEEAPEWVNTNRPTRSPAIALTTVSRDTPLVLVSENDQVGFVIADSHGVYGDPESVVEIPANTPETPITTSFYVVPKEGCPANASTNIVLYRRDSMTPIGWTHKDMPGTTDHTRIPYIVLSESDYEPKTTVIEPSV